MRSRGDLTASVGAGGDVRVEGHFVGTLEGFRFAPDPSVSGSAGDAGRSGTAAAVRALAAQIRQRVSQLEADDDNAFALAADGMIAWRKEAVGQLHRGSDVLSPRVEPLASDLLGGEARERLRRRLALFATARLRARLAPLYRAREATVAGAAARGLLWQLAESLGMLPRRSARSQIAALSRSDRQALAAAGVRLGHEAVWIPRLLKPEAMALRGLLYWLQAGGVGARRGWPRPAVAGSAVPGAAGIPRGVRLPARRQHRRSHRRRRAGARIGAASPPRRCHHPAAGGGDGASAWLPRSAPAADARMPRLSNGADRGRTCRRFREIAATAPGRGRHRAAGRTLVLHQGRPERGPLAFRRPAGAASRPMIAAAPLPSAPPAPAPRQMAVVCPIPVESLAGLRRLRRRTGSG